MTPASSARETNHLLAALPFQDWQLLQPQLEWVELLPGTMLHEAGSVLRYVYFPSTAVVSLVSTLRDGSAAEVAVVGNEGMVGVCAFMGGGCAHSGAVVQGGGHALRMTAQAISDLARRSPGLMQQLLLYTQALFTHMSQTAACTRHHGLEQQLCRWLLLNLDRLQGDEMLITQEQIAGLLGVRREGISGYAHALRKAGVIRCGRGRISVLDRARLEERSCECYLVVTRAYERLLSSLPARSTVRGGRARVLEAA